MITVRDSSAAINGQKGSVLSLVGLSTDTKPTGTYQGWTIGNGSSFFEMDTQNVKFYSEDSNTWV